MIPVKPGSLLVGDRATLGIRPEHLRLNQNNASLNGEVLVVERLGGETYLYVKIAGGDTLVVQTDGDNPARIRDRVPIYINGELCHLFNQQGEAIPKARRHHLTLNESHEQQYQHRFSNQAE
jgi:multiple sugar transport system ATP-binding protein